MADSPSVLMYWYDEEQAQMVLQVGRFGFQWAFISETRGDTYANLSGWTSWPYPDAPEDRVSLRCHDHAEAVRVIEALAAIRGFTVSQRPQDSSDAR